jgi:hypothetical protein
MATKHKSLNLKHFFGAFAVLFLVMSVGVFVYASQNKTNTESEASNGRLIPNDKSGKNTGCGKDPEITLLDSVGRRTSVVYTLRIKNRDRHNPQNRDTNCKIDIYHITVDMPRTWHASVKGEDTNTNNIALKENESKKLTITVTRPTNYKNKGTHNIIVKAANQRHDDNEADGIKVLKYTVE